MFFFIVYFNFRLFLIKTLIIISCRLSLDDLVPVRLYFYPEGAVYADSSGIIKFSVSIIKCDGSL